MPLTCEEYLVLVLRLVKSVFGKRFICYDCIVSEN